MSKIEEYLKSLGSTPQEVAENLELQGITGEIGNAQFCPVIKAIYKKFPKLSKGLIVQIRSNKGGYANFNGLTLYFKRSERVVITWNDCQTTDPLCPQAVQDFVKEFDNGKYPHLEGLSQDQLKQQAINKLTLEEKLALGIG